MAEKEKGQALAKRPTQEQLEKAYAAILDGASIPQVGDPEVISRAIAERIMSSDTFEEAFQPQALVAWREALLGVPVKVQELHLNPTGFSDSASSVYAVVDVIRLDSGEEITVTCGGRNVLMQLVKMLEKGWTDKAVKLTAKQTAEGYDALWLEAA